MFFRFADGNGFSQRISSAHKEAEFQFVIERLGRPEFRSGVAIARLSGGAPDRRSARQPATMPARDSQSECICNSAAADYRVGIASRRWWRGRSMHRNPCSRRSVRAGASQHPTARGDGGKRLADRRQARPAATGHEAAGAKRAAYRLQAPSANSANRRRKHSPPNASFRPQDMPSFLHSAEVENAVSNRDSHAPASAPPSRRRKTAEGQILNGKIGARNVGGFDPTLYLRNRGSRRERVS